MEGRVATILLFLSCLGAACAQDCVENTQSVEAPAEVIGIWNGWLKPTEGGEKIGVPPTCLNIAFRTKYVTSIAHPEDDAKSCAERDEIKLSTLSLQVETMSEIRSVHCKENGEVELIFHHLAGPRTDQGIILDVCSIARRDDDEDGPKLLFTTGFEVERPAKPVCPSGIMDRSSETVSSFAEFKPVNNDDIVLDTKKFACVS